MTRRMLRGLLPLLALLTVAGSGLALWRTQAALVPQPPFTLAQPLAVRREAGLEVSLVLEYDRAGQAVLAGTFAPLEAGSHVYSIDLPPAGIDGAGRPTRLEIPPGQAVRAVGGALADRPAELRMLDGFSSAFPIYPDGAVTLRVPIAGLARSGALETQVSVSYMVCSSRGYCLPPVENRLVTVQLPKGA